MNFQNALTKGQLACLKNVTVEEVTAKAFVASYDQMNGGFSYFNNSSKRSVGSVYWTSTSYNTEYPWYVRADGVLDYGKYNVEQSYFFRPSVCLDLTLLG